MSTSRNNGYMWRTHNNIPRLEVCLRVFQEYLKSISRVSQEYLKSISRVSQEYHKSISRVSQEYLKSISRVYQEYIKSISRVYQEYLKSISSGFYSVFGGPYCFIDSNTGIILLCPRYTVSVLYSLYLSINRRTNRHGHNSVLDIDGYYHCRKNALMWKTVMWKTHTQHSSTKVSSIVPIVPIITSATIVQLKGTWHASYILNEHVKSTAFNSAALAAVLPNVWYESHSNHKQHRAQATGHRSTIYQ